MSISPISNFECAQQSPNSSTSNKNLSLNNNISNGSPPQTSPVSRVSFLSLQVSKSEPGNKRETNNEQNLGSDDSMSPDVKIILDEEDLTGLDTPPVKDKNSPGSNDDSAIMDTANKVSKLRISLPGNSLPK